MKPRLRQFRSAIRLPGPHRPAARFWRAREGATTVEFAILAGPFFLLLFALIETALVFIGDISLQHAVERVGREVRTGQNTQAARTVEDFRERICDNVALIECDELAIDLRSYDSFDEIDTRAPVKDGVLDRSGLVYETASADRIMALRTYYVWPLYTDLIRKSFSNVNDGFLIGAATAFRTEPFE